MGSVSWGGVAAVAVMFVGVPAFIPHPEIFASLLPGSPAEWYDPHDASVLIPVRTLSAGLGLVLLPVVSRFDGALGSAKAAEKV